MGEAVREAAARLEKAGHEEPRIEAVHLVGGLLGWSNTDVILRDEQILDGDALRRIDDGVARRAKFEPVAYIVGRKNFMGRDFEVDRRVLVPRPETEILVETSADLCRLAGLSSPRILEVGTGSGCVALSLAWMFPGATVVASDASNEALEVAAANAHRMAAGLSVRLVLSDLYQELSPDLRGYFDIIASNPPYVTSPELSTLEPDLFFEPRSALDGGPDGLRVIRPLVSGAPDWLKPGGALVLEIGAKQGDPVRELLTARGFKDVAVRPDVHGLDRIASGRWHGSI